MGARHQRPAFRGDGSLVLCGQAWDADRTRTTVADESGRVLVGLGGEAISLDIAGPHLLMAVEEWGVHSSDPPIYRLVRHDGISLAEVAAGVSDAAWGPREAGPDERCVAPTLVPTSLPEGSAEVDGKALAVEKSIAFVQGPEVDWVRGWTSGSDWLVIAGGPRGDFGDDPSVRRVEVRGFAGAAGDGGDGRTILTWTEPSACELGGFEQYVVVWSGFGYDEVVSTAQSLVPVAYSSAPGQSSVSDQTAPARVVPDLEHLPKPRPGVTLPTPKSDLVHGGEAYGVYLAAMIGDAEQEWQEAWQRLTETFGDKLSSGSTGCDQGAEEALAAAGVRNSRYAAAMYFSTQEDAQRFDDALDRPPLAVALVRTGCLD